MRNNSIEEKKRLRREYKSELEGSWTTCQGKVLPKKYHTSIDLSPNKKHKKLALSLFKKSVFLYGKSGVGKTFIASLIYKRALAKGHSVQYVNYPNFIMDIQLNFKRYGDEISDNIQEMCTFGGLMFLDDFGGERCTDFVRSITYNIINQRESRELKTIITSNYNLNEIAEQIDARIASRIAGHCEVIELSGKDMRQESPIAERCKESKEDQEKKPYKYNPHIIPGRDK